MGSVEYHRRAPMASAPMRYRLDGKADWGVMWSDFCVLAQEGGPPHRGTMLYAQENPDIYSPDYHFAALEIIRGINEVSGLQASLHKPGWVAVQSLSASMARWMCEAIIEENVEARYEGTLVFVPVGDNYTLKEEIKNVITVVAKTSHYWEQHVTQSERKEIAWQVQQERMKQFGIVW